MDKERDLVMIDGKICDHYAHIWHYIKPRFHFESRSWCQPGCKKITFLELKIGWTRGYIKVIGLDGSFLKRCTNDEDKIELGVKFIVHNPKQKWNHLNPKIGKCDWAKQRALVMIDEIIRSNPGSTLKVGVGVNLDVKNYFHSFQALKIGWTRGYIKVIGLDGSFLKRPI
uniref:Uncharacterized protein n=1 Tax=Lactuca sativa TaxID=4236 RepID=A0A9R1WM08_LACSA|nr:hypothetical protein LSAT_V11C100044320 [Lactuca sativa]